MPIDLYPNIAKVKRDGVYQNLPGFVEQSGNADIEAMIANKETSTTAQFAHDKDSFFILNDILYQADENIAINDIIAVGTNCHVEVLGNDVFDLIVDVASQSEKIDNLQTTFNYFDSTKLQNGKVITADGNAANVANWGCTPLFPTQKGDIIEYAWGNYNVVTNVPAIVFYDESYTFCGYAFKDGSNYNDGKVIVENDNIKYFRYNVASPYYKPLNQQYLRVTTNRTFAILKNLYNTLSCIDYFDANKIVTGYFLSNLTGLPVANGYYNYLDVFVPVHAGDVVLFPTDYSIGDLPALLFYDKNYNFINGFITPTKNDGKNNLDYFYIITDERVSYLRYNVMQNSWFPISNQYLKVISFSPKENTEHVYYVGSTRTGENGFTTLKACCEFFEKNFVTGATVYFDAEEFNVATEYGSTYLDSYTYGSGARPGPRFGWNNHYIFAKGSKITFTYSGENHEVYEYFSPVNIAGSCIIEGANIIAENCRYCVHDDLPTSGNAYVGNPYTVEFKNCHMEHKGNSEEVANSPLCIGGGTNKNSRHIIDGGVYKTNSEQASYQISYHNYNMTTYGEGVSEVIIRNVYTTAGVRYATYGNSPVDLIINGCYLPDGIMGSSEYFDVKEWNNTVNT